MKTIEVSKRVENAIEDIAIANRSSLSYKELNSIISKTAKKYNLSEAFIRTVGVYPLRNAQPLMKLIQEMKLSN